MDPWQMLTSVLAMFSAALGWWLITLHNRHEKLRADHEELRVRVAEKYLQKDDMRDMMDDMKQDLHALIQSLKEEMRASLNRAHAGR
nr:hypothetical protein [Chromobacterium sp. ASV5]